MNWIDIVLFIVIAAVAVLEMARGFGRAIFDALALYGALWVAEMLAAPLADHLQFNPHHSVNHCVILAVLLLALGALAIVLSRFVYEATLINTGMFEGLLGLCAGVAVGMIAAHGIVRVLSMSDPAGVMLAIVHGSGLGSEMLSFSSYHSVLDTLTNLTAGHNDLPNANS